MYKLSTSEGESIMATKFKFETSSQAWDFMRRCETAKAQAGYPSLKREDGFYTVQVRDTDVERAKGLVAS